MARFGLKLQLAAGSPSSEGTAEAALAAEVFLRFPGQWEKELWADAALGTGGIHYNVYRWYQPGTGRYTRTDPIGLSGGFNLFGYAWQNPISFRDWLGLATFMCKRPLKALPDAGQRSGPDIALNPLYHQYICIKNGQVTNCGGHTADWPYFPGRPSSPQDDFFHPDRCEEILPDNACIERCLIQRFGEKRPFYGFIGPGTNCQEWADDSILVCRVECEPPPPLNLPKFKGFF